MRITSISAGRKIIILFLLAAFLLSGCGKKEIFQQEEDPNEIKPLDMNELENDTCYVKNGTKFYVLYTPNGNNKGNYSPQNIYWMQDDIRQIPTYYKGELIAYASEESYISSFEVQRYKDNGYSIGLYGASVNEDGEITFSVKKNTIAGSSMNDVFQNAKSDNIRIVTINDKAVDETMLNTAGCVTGLEEGKSYQISFYAGSYYQTLTVDADEHLLQYYEDYTLDEPQNTKNGYFKMSMPEDAKSGWYLIPGQGFFEYYDFAKGEGDTEETELNDPYYTSQNEQLSQYSQQFFAMLNEDVKDAVFEVTYTTGVYADADIVCKLVAPDDSTTYDMPAVDGTATVTIKSAVAGRWSINVYPKDLDVTSASVNSGKTKQDAMQTSQTLHFDTDNTNIIFCADVIGSTDVWGTVTYEDGSAYEMSYNNYSGRLEYPMNYVKAGDYTVDVYFYENTAIQNITTEKNTDNYTDEIIRIEE